jgi:hypothetical protein
VISIEFSIGIPILIQPEYIIFPAKLYSGLNEFETHKK